MSPMSFQFLGFSFQFWYEDRTISNELKTEN
jgi:hypothetical protein